jgi:hypothetical protein
MTTALDARFAELLRLASSDPQVLAFWLDGSRGKGQAGPHADYDCTLVVADTVLEAYRARHARQGHMDLDVTVTSLEAFRDHAAWQGPEHGYRYNFARLTPLVDRTGGVIQGLIDEKGRVPPERVTAFIEASLDHFVNQVYRSLKCRRDGRVAGARLEAGEAIPPLLDALFALHGGRLRPYHKYLEWELEQFALDSLPWSREVFVAMLLEVLDGAEAAVLQDLLRHSERLFRGRAFGHVFDAWGEAMAFMLAFGAGEASPGARAY